ncbi:hypothetical protein ACFE04_005079 [Oxalis oulophora]
MGFVPIRNRLEKLESFSLYGYAHVANNLYQGWTQYAIGGSQSPRIKSESNFFSAPNSEHKEVTWKQNKNGQKFFYSVGDLFKNGTSFSRTVDLIIVQNKHFKFNLPRK